LHQPRLRRGKPEELKNKKKKSLTELARKQPPASRFGERYVKRGSARVTRNTAAMREASPRNTKTDAYASIPVVVALAPFPSRAPSSSL
jgi:hypothetical protein